MGRGLYDQTKAPLEQNHNPVIRRTKQCRKIGCGPGTAAVASKHGR